MKQLEYMTVTASNASELDVRVNRAMEDGYCLHGHPYVTSTDYVGFSTTTRQYTLCQAMIKNLPLPRPEPTPIPSYGKDFV